MLIPWCEPHSAGVRCGRWGGYPALWKDNKGRKFRARTRLAEKVPHQLTPATGNLSKFPMPRFSPRFSPSCGQCGHANSTCLRRVDWRSNTFFITPELSNRHLELPSLLSSNLQHQLLTCTPTPPSSQPALPTGGLCHTEVVTHPFHFLPRSDLTIHLLTQHINFYCCSVGKSCPALYNPMDCSLPGSPVLHYFLEFTLIHVHGVADII